MVSTVRHSLCLVFPLPSWRRALPFFPCGVDGRRPRSAIRDESGRVCGLQFLSILDDS